MRLRNIPGAEEALREYPTFVDNPAGMKGRWKERFGNDHPIHIEIGCGKGRFINTLAERHPDINFIAIELKAEVVLRAAQRTEKREIPNLAFVQYNAALLPDLFGAEEVSRIYLNFSDPWPKTRHAKRRLTYASFLNTYKQVLKKNGEIHLKTDNEKLFEFSLNQFSNERFQLRNITFDLHQSALAEENVMTEYEERFSSRGQRIYRTEAIFRS
ncbi:MULTISPECIES: tRNA (guanosine(46)-N7)-methyltransferase TrmB [Brevibacillus]|jgi:tRNA (guanine-N7-)-methyltransferase|uniref:tRNA (guanine-N(7)-)-methyltransferase n=1 Tax=Brevibacillus borstelensis AK1 TaxID=1300222 RepID=M8E9A6_9BACL|nr:tRNA (guanosine(46)-N7)-methyltransferase TrmB [Brevibacillus borstelensis]EMT52055.1 tRNA (guanine-N(7)-)-methyltransferase [Brevibacillus borstelensis AK1]KKX53566.1 tRNA (guanine-N7)-methyltransferase [Brevibacillus borstelensis cifa_chp40]MBE5396059.1 tRNA (guanosine(46)-N7)-methyltransferase TrmB [Brevibacillus borstelensis]MCC0566625.1 tRNA (guanosine(46)-N7)-methyltransferase TrmB [Brevibacillus borstelensis]MCM3472658.1 tRNA (guanosine(46)-N7)-methyltransferase TrmB [Brevibacillus b